ncbi:hypothetical protein E2320_018850, partial [Naja naja]
VTSNCFSISNGEMQDVGVGLYPSMSLLNNSCDPNCVVIFEGPQLHLRSIREMQLGEENSTMLFTTKCAQPFVNLYHSLRLNMKVSRKEAKVSNVLTDTPEEENVSGLCHTQLTISYTETVMPTPERQQNLKRQYCFECDCVMCSTQSK